MHRSLFRSSQLSVLTNEDVARKVIVKISIYYFIAEQFDSENGLRSFFGVGALGRVFPFIKWKHATILFMFFFCFFFEGATKQKKISWFSFAKYIYVNWFKERVVSAKIMYSRSIQCVESINSG